MMNQGMNHGMGNRMGGMLTESELSTLNSLSGSEFDIYWLRGMITHHEGALHMVTMIQLSRKPLRFFGFHVSSLKTCGVHWHPLGTIEERHSPQSGSVASEHMPVNQASSSPTPTQSQSPTEQPEKSSENIS
jgi:hypothetical protein